MNVLAWLRKKILNFLGIEHLSSNPKGERMTFISDDEEIRLFKLRECKVWYYGDDSEILNFYTNARLYSLNSNPIYNRNKKQFFWAQASTESDIKRVHSGLAHAITSTLVNVIGNHRASSADPDIDAAMDAISERNNLAAIVNQEEMPLTLAEGYGAFKYTFDKDLDDVPIIEYYDAENVQFIYQRKRLIGVVFIDYYKDKKGHDYVLFETRRIQNRDSLIEFKLFKLKGNDLKEAELTDLPETEKLPAEGYRIPGLNEVLATPTIFFYDTMNQGYGRSIYEGKIALFDDLDLTLSQQSQTIKVSTPVEYYDSEAMGFTSNGLPKPPTAFNRQFIAKFPMRDGNGNTRSNAVETTQPRLDFNQYGLAARQILSQILTGLMSEASMGIDLARDDNALAQREKEKVTMMTRNNVIARQTHIIKDLYRKCLMLWDYMKTGAITIKDYQIDVKYDEFANPSFENELPLLSQALANGSISPEQYVDRLYGDSLSDERKAYELEYVKSFLQAQAQAMGGDIL